MNATLSQVVQIRVDAGAIEGMLERPANARGVVVFAHGSGSGRSSPRNNFVAEQLRQGGVGTLLVDLLLESEESNYPKRFDVPLLTQRLTDAADWVIASRAAGDLPLGLFGASTGAAAALRLAAGRPQHIAAVVSRGGRPDLAGDNTLTKVRAPTLLIVGKRDEDVVALNEAAYARLTCRKRLELVPDATHLFEEPGTLKRAAELATHWFEQHLRADVGTVAFAR